jgi:SAM-dependent methyltransferase
MTAVRRNVDVLDELLDVRDRDVLDVGCGDGWLVRRLARHGARATGVDTGEAALAQARAHPEAKPEAYRRAGAGELAFAEGAFDFVIFFNSLHHVAPAALDRALGEATRVLRATGRLYVQEPLAQGPYFEVCRPIEDETDVRAAAYAALRRAADLRMEREIAFDAPVRFESFEAFRSRQVLSNPARAATFARREAELRAIFEATAGVADDGAYRFLQPTRVNLLRPVG